MATEDRPVTERRRSDRPPASPTRQGVGAISGRYVLAWCALWFVAHMATLWLVSEFLLDKVQGEAFAAMMGIGLPAYLTIGILASYFVAKVTRRNWTYLTGAAVVGFGVGICIFAADHGGVLYRLVQIVDYAFVCMAIGGVVMVFLEGAKRRKRV